MASQLGRALLIKVGDGASPEVFTTVAALRTKSIAINGGEPADVSDSESTNQWRELLAATGLSSITITGDGVFKDGATDATLYNKVVPQQLAANYQIVIPDFQTIEGSFIITQLEFTGEHENAVTFSITLESAGALTTTAA